jgi:Raf kinase inhibitor-like YbhB/YbcL family protein
MEIKLQSTAFEDGELIPSKYTCDGKNISPPLKWENIPEETQSIAIICDDPDAPMGIWVHWIIFNLPPETSRLEENFPDDETFPDGTRQGINDFGAVGYGGPCPPAGSHRYFFKIYALDMLVSLVTVVDKQTLLETIDGHIIAHGQLIGRYHRKRLDTRCS